MVGHATYRNLREIPARRRHPLCPDPHGTPRPCLDHGILELDYNPDERGTRAIALGRKNYLFVGSEAGGKAAAIAHTLIETAKLNAVDPHAWLADTLARIPDHKITKVDDLIPWNWRGQRSDRTVTDCPTPVGCKSTLPLTLPRLHPPAPPLECPASPNPRSSAVIRAGCIALCLCPLPALAAPCGNTPDGYEAWKVVMAQEARAEGVGKAGIAALKGTAYSRATISADRNQKSFKYSLAKFMQVRGADAIVSQGRSRKARNAGFYAGLEAQYGVPAGVILAIHGMETGFGGFMGDTNVVSAIATLTWDCRRSDFFRPHLIGALKLVDAGEITPGTLGAKHGELGHTQFLPGNALAYGVDGNGDGRIDFANVADALASTANFLRQKGWKPGRGYQEGEANFAVLKAWNAASVYQQALAIMGARIDG